MEQVPPTEPYRPRVPTILCVDDSVAFEPIYRKLLGERGYDVLFCSRGSEVLPIMTAQPVDLVLLDMMMPEMTGTDVIRAVKAEETLADTPIIVVSGCSGEDIIEDSLREGVVDYIVKPLRTGELCAKVSIALKNWNRSGVDLPGQLNQRFDVLAQIGSGGFSTVYKAVDRGQPHEPVVALKVLKYEAHGDNQTVLQRFLREAYEHSKLDHPAIVKLLDFGQSDNVYYLVTEFVEGRSLQEQVDLLGPMEGQSALRLGCDVADALQYLLLQKVMHRDLKPANIMVTDTLEVKLLDFGLARREFDDTLSVEHSVQGTVNFMSNEQLQGAEVDFRTDIYALGATLYFALTGKPPYEGKTVYEVINLHITSSPEPLSQHRPELSPAAVTLIESMLAKDIEERPVIAKIASVLNRLTSASRAPQSEMDNAQE